MSRSSISPPPPAASTFISREDLSRETGLSIQAIDKRLRDKSIASTKLGRRVLIPRQEIFRLLTQAGSR